MTVRSGYFFFTVALLFSTLSPNQNAQYAPVKLSGPQLPGRQSRPDPKTYLNIVRIHFKTVDEIIEVPAELSQLVIWFIVKPNPNFIFVFGGYVE